MTRRNKWRNNFRAQQVFSSARSNSPMRDFSSKKFRNKSMENRQKKPNVTRSGYDSSSDEGGYRFAKSKHRKGHSSSTVRELPKGSDTCAFEQMSDQTADKLQTQWQNQKPLRKVTLPMMNHGNTCFFNAVMQCLTHTVLFHQYCLSETHQKSCKQKEKG